MSQGSALAPSEQPAGVPFARMHTPVYPRLDPIFLDERHGVILGAAPFLRTTTRGKDWAAFLAGTRALDHR